MNSKEWQSSAVTMDHGQTAYPSAQVNTTCSCKLCLIKIPSCHIFNEAETRMEAVAQRQEEKEKKSLRTQ